MSGEEGAEIAGSSIAVATQTRKIIQPEEVIPANDLLKPPVYARASDKPQDATRRPVVIRREFSNQSIYSSHKEKGILRKVLERVLPVLGITGVVAAGGVAVAPSDSGVGQARQEAGRTAAKLGVNVNNLVHSKSGVAIEDSVARLAFTSPDTSSQANLRNRLKEIIENPSEYERLVHEYRIRVSGTPVHNQPEAGDMTTKVGYLDEGDIVSGIEVSSIDPNDSHKYIGFSLDQVDHARDAGNPNIYKQDVSIENQVLGFVQDTRADLKNKNTGT